VKKVLFVVPHLSTGGMPQYTLSLIKKIINDVDVYCVEYSMISPTFVVQRTQIEQLLGNNFYSLGLNKNQLMDIIYDINPDIVHLQELPESFISNEIANLLYSVNRKYSIVETSHDSSFDSRNKRFFPDYFALISEHQRKEFLKMNIPIKIVESDIEYKERQDREIGLRNLGLDPNLSHVLNVGLFTPRKNQSEIFEYAKQMVDLPIQFHFVGNQADNFKSYWEPLLNDIPSNVKIWGERSDVDNFYSCMDLFLFTSRGTGNDKETSPLVIREAIGNGIPLLIYNLPVYNGMYDKYDSIEYLDFLDLNSNIEKIKRKLNIVGETVVMPRSLQKFDILYKNTENKIEYKSNEYIPKLLVCIRDIDSNTVIWSAKHEHFYPNSWHWIIPIPKGYYDFETNPDFGGFIVEMYSDDELIQSKEFRIKTPSFEKPVSCLVNNSEPVFINYNEFFVDNIYNDFIEGKSYDTVVDVGANVGLWIEYIKHFSSVKNIYAVEPNKVALKILNDSFGDTITIIDKALHTTDETITFYVNENNSTISSIDNHSSFASSYDVETVTIKSLVRDYDIQHIDLLKIDIESAEYELINSFDGDDFEIIDNMLIEYHLMGGKTFDDVNNIKNILIDNGYNVEVKIMHETGGFILATKEN
jgi:FkbM family methyltransferase